MSILKIHLFFKNVNKTFFSFAVFTVTENKKNIIHMKYSGISALKYCLKLLSSHRPSSIH